MDDNFGKCLAILAHPQTVPEIFKSLLGLPGIENIPDDIDIVIHFTGVSGLYSFAMGDRKSEHQNYAQYLIELAELQDDSILIPSPTCEFIDSGVFCRGFNQSLSDETKEYALYLTVPDAELANSSVLLMVRSFKEKIANDIFTGIKEKQGLAKAAVDGTITEWKLAYFLPDNVKGKKAISRISPLMSAVDEFVKKSEQAVKTDVNQTLSDQYITDLSIGFCDWLRESSGRSFVSEALKGSPKPIKVVYSGELKKDDEWFLAVDADEKGFRRIIPRDGKATFLCRSVFYKGSSPIYVTLLPSKEAAAYYAGNPGVIKITERAQWIASPTEDEKGVDESLDQQSKNASVNPEVEQFNENNDVFGKAKEAFFNHAKAKLINNGDFKFKEFSGEVLVEGTKYLGSLSNKSIDIIKNTLGLENLPITTQMLQRKQRPISIIIESAANISKSEWYFKLEAEGEESSGNLVRLSGRQSFVKLRSRNISAPSITNGNGQKSIFVLPSIAALNVLSTNELTENRTFLHFECLLANNNGEPPSNDTPPDPLKSQLLDELDGIEIFAFEGVKIEQNGVKILARYPNKEVGLKRVQSILCFGVKEEETVVNGAEDNTRIIEEGLRKLSALWESHCKYIGTQCLVNSEFSDNCTYEVALTVGSESPKSVKFGNKDLFQFQKQKAVEIFKYLYNLDLVESFNIKRIKSTIFVDKSVDINEINKAVNELSSEMLKSIKIEPDMSKNFKLNVNDDNSSVPDHETYKLLDDISGPIKFDGLKWIMVVDFLRKLTIPIGIWVGLAYAIPYSVVRPALDNYKDFFDPGFIDPFSDRLFYTLIMFALLFGAAISAKEWFKLKERLKEANFLIVANKKQNLIISKLVALSFKKINVREVKHDF